MNSKLATIKLQTFIKQRWFSSSLKIVCTGSYQGTACKAMPTYFVEKLAAVESSVPAVLMAELLAALLVVEDGVQ